jgi:hypothetical protein
MNRAEYVADGYPCSLRAVALDIYIRLFTEVYYVYFDDLTDRNRDISRHSLGTLDFKLC